MILIDALNINSGGGAVLLEYLLSQMDKKRISYHVLLDIRYKGQPSFITNATLLKSNFITRTQIIKENIKKYQPDTLFCFGNYPPPQKYNSVRIVTYFQNAHLVSSLKAKTTPLKERILLRLKRFYLQYCLKNTNWVVLQSNFIAEEFIKSYNYDRSQTKVIPFFDLDKLTDLTRDLIDIKKEKDTCIYTSSGATHKNHLLLFEAWRLLAQEQITPLLYLTIPTTSNLINTITELNQKGANIINLGTMEQSAILDYTSRCQYCIYPSLLETIGLGLVESALLGTTVICADQSFTKEIIQPSLTFDPLSAISIANSVKYVLSDEKHLQNTKVLLKNEIKILLQFLQPNNS